MRRITFLMIALVSFTSFVFAQDKKPASPKAEVSGKLGSATVKIVYSQPSAKGRKIMGELVPYGQVWRTGANAATTLEFDKPVKVEGKDLAAGKYSLFTIPGEKEWTIIINKQSGQSGMSYTESEDALRVTVKPTKTPAFVETFTIEPANDQITLKWENTAVAFKVKG